MLELQCAEDLLALGRATGKTLPALVVEYESELSGQPAAEIYETMHHRLQIMKESVEQGLDDPGALAHLAKGYGLKMKMAADEGRLVGGQQLQRITMYALAVAQHNASLGRIAACPTAGSCGVLPAALLCIAEDRGADDGALVDALLTAAGIGTVSAMQGPISGAEGGCQAECGVASAMAAGAVVELAGGSAEAVFDAASLALQNLLGLVCDPVAGLVEIPCITRNACAAGNAVMAADMVRAGIPAVIPFDETVRAMKQIGRAMPESLRETSKGGLAASSTAKRIHRRMQREHQLEEE